MWYCQIKKAEGKLTERERRFLSEQLRNLAMSYDIDYAIVTKSK